MIKLNKDGLSAPSVTTESITMNNISVSSNSSTLKETDAGTLIWNDNLSITTAHSTAPASISTKGDIFNVYFNGTSGASIHLYNKNVSTSPGFIYMQASDGTNNSNLFLRPDGSLVLNENLYFNTTSSTSDASILSNGDYVKLGTRTDGAEIRAYSKDHTNAGRVELRTSDGTTSKYLMLNPDGTLTWGGSNVVTYSLLNNLGSSIAFNTDATVRTIGYGLSDRARLAFYNKTHASWPGFFQLSVPTDDGAISLVGSSSSGALTWDTKRILTELNHGHIYFDHTLGTQRDVGFSTGNGNTNKGAYMSFFSGDHTSAAGVLRLSARNATSECTLKCYPNGDLTWNDGYIVPVGTIVAYTSSTIPAGWLYCGGGAVSRTTYAKLFSVIGTKYGAGDGSTTFNLPGVQGYFLQGYTSSVALGSKDEPGLPDIQGTVNLSAGSTGARLGLVRGTSGAFSLMTAAQTNPNSVANLSNVYEGFSFKASSYNSVYGRTSTTVQPPAITVAYIIKYK